MHTSKSSISGFWGESALDCDNYHYEYQVKLDEWSEIDKALTGGKIWTDNVIEKYECESQGHLNLRRHFAWDRISVKPPLQSMQNMARGSADQASINGASERINKILDEDFDNNGNGWYSWLVENAGLFAPAFGKYFIFASSPASLSELTKENEKDHNPFAFGRNPLQVINWRFENGDTRENGQFADILFLTSEIVINSETLFEDRVDIAVRITREDVFIIAVDDCFANTVVDGLSSVGDFSRGDLIRSFPNPIGIVPCRLVDLGESIIRDIINASAQSINIQTGMYAGVFDGNFNQRVIMGGNTEDEISLGTDTLLKLSENQEYKIVEAPSGEIDVAIKFFQDTQDGVDTIMQQQWSNLAKKGGSAPSGEALTQMNSDKVQAVKVVMDLAGDALEDIVAWMHLLAGEAVPIGLSVVMPTSYESTTQEDRISLALDTQSIEVSSVEGLAIRERNKWQNLATSEELDNVVTAEVEAQKDSLAALNMMSSVDSAGNFGDGETSQDGSP